VDRLANHVGSATEQPLPGLVADDDRAGLLLLHHVLEVLVPVRAAEERCDPRDREAIHVHRHLRDAAHLDARERDRRPPALEEAERLERASVLQDRLHHLPVGRLVPVAALLVRLPEHRQPVAVLEVELVVGDIVHHAVQRRGGSDAEAEREPGDDDQRGVALPQAQRVAEIRELDHGRPPDSPEYTAALDAGFLILLVCGHQVQGRPRPFRIGRRTR
jgi:hypothetical protein